MKKKLCLSAALSLCLVSLVGCTKVQARMEIREGNTAYEAENYAKALQHYQKAREIDGQSFPELDRMIGYSLIGTYVPEDKTPQNVNKADAAIIELRKYLRKNPDDQIAREALINLYLNADRTTEAINYFREWLKTHPNDLDAVRSVATLYAKQGNFAEAMNWYEKITLIDQKNPEAHYTFGVVLYEKVAKDPPADVAERLRLILRELAEGGQGDSWLDAVAISTACHTSIRAGQPLSLPEMRELVADLEQSSQPRACGHGRPTMLHMTQTELERQFSRR